MTLRRERTSELRAHSSALARCAGSLRASSSGLLGVVAALLAPETCRACALPLLRADAWPVCDACLSGLQPTAYAVCWRCGDAIGVEAQSAARLVQPEALRCATCRQADPPFARANAFAAYRGTLRQLIHLHKFEGVRPLAEPLGRRLADAIAVAHGRERRPMLVVAVPLHRRKRAFNQSVLLADAALRSLHTSHPDWKLKAAHELLQRVRRTDSQSHLTPDKRRENVRGAFRADAVHLRGQDVLLVDDVYTTGATAAECTRTLLRAGAASVCVVTLARAHKHSDMPDDGDTFAVAAFGREPGIPYEIAKHAEAGEWKQ